MECTLEQQWQKVKDLKMQQNLRHQQNMFPLVNSQGDGAVGFIKIEQPLKINVVCPDKKQAFEKIIPKYRGWSGAQAGLRLTDPTTN